LHKSKLAQWHYNNQFLALESYNSAQQFRINDSAQQAAMQLCPPNGKQTRMQSYRPRGKKIPKVEGRRAHCDFPRFEFDQNGTALNHREMLPFLYQGHGKL
jgi:hypothetical protein